MFLFVCFSQLGVGILGKDLIFGGVGVGFVGFDHGVLEFEMLGFVCEISWIIALLMLVLAGFDNW